MAPIASPSKKRVIEILQKENYQKYIPLTLGSGSPKAQITLNNNVFRFNLLGIPEEKQREVDRIAKKNLEEQGLWMPENEWEFYEETQCLLETRNKESLIEFIKKIEWNYGGQDNYLLN